MVASWLPAPSQLLRTLLFGVTTYNAVTMIAALSNMLITAIAAIVEPMDYGRISGSIDSSSAL